MYKKERVDRILRILEKNGYVSAKYLCEELGYSKATVNRDLNFLENQNLVVRSYGGVELVEKKGVPLNFRYHKMKNEKKNLCKAASELVNDGDVIFIDGASTTEYIAHYLTDRHNLTVITNNVSVAAYLSDFSNIRTICLGGEIVETPSMLAGELCVKNAMEFKADKFFFASHGINDDGEIGNMGFEYNLLLNVMAKNSKQVIYLVDHTKINLDSKSVIMTADKLDVIITDYVFAEDFKKKYGNVEFVELK